MDQASIESELSPSPTQASKAEVRRAKARENSRRTRQKKKLEMIYTATRIQTALSDTRLLNESRQQCASIHQFQAFLIDEHLLEMLLQRRAQLDARNAQVKLQFQDAIAHINRYRCNFLLPPPRFSLNLLHPVPLLPPLAVDIGTCQELANFSASPYVRTYFVPFRGWDIQIWNSGDCTVNVKSNLSVNWNPEMAMNTTWEILKSPNRSHQILLDIPTHGVMQVQQLISDDLVVVQRLVQPPMGLCFQPLEPQEFVSVLFRRRVGSMFLVGMKSIPVTSHAGCNYPMRG